MNRVVFCEVLPMIRKLVKIGPDVGFSDVAMPEMDGFKLADLRARVAQFSKN